MQATDAWLKLRVPLPQCRGTAHHLCVDSYDPDPHRGSHRPHHGVQTFPDKKSARIGLHPIVRSRPQPKKDGTLHRDWSKGALSRRAEAQQAADPLTRGTVRVPTQVALGVRASLRRAPFAVKGEDEQDLCL